MAAPDVKLIGIHGVKESGKDTTADFIQQYAAEQHKSFGKDWFARRMKESIAALFGITLEQVDIFKVGGVVTLCIKANAPYGEIKPRNIIQFTGREFCQRYGTESHRGVFGWDFWIDLLLPNPDDDLYPTSDPSWQRDNFKAKDVCVIADVRFENEIQRIHDCGGKVIYLDRPTDKPKDAHVSEQMFPELCDVEICNDRGLPELEENVRNAIQFLYG